MMPSLNPRQDAILKFIAAYFKEHLYAPSAQEIADAVGCGVGSVYYNLSTLMMRGYLIYEGHRRIGLLWKA